MLSKVLKVNGVVSGLLGVVLAIVPGPIGRLLARGPWEPSES